MARWLEGIIEPELVPIASWIIIAFIALIAIFIAYRIIRAMTSGAFLMRGRNRKARLAVMDAAAIDDKRRLVLVRRDDVEHLILIGGANDIVVEHDIRMVPKTARPYPADPESSLAEEQSEQRAPAFVPPPIGRPSSSTPRATLPLRQAEPRLAATPPLQRPSAQAASPNAMRPSQASQPAPQQIRSTSAPAPLSATPPPAHSPRPAAQPVASYQSAPRPVAPSLPSAMAPRPAPAAPMSAAVSRPAAARASNDADLDEALLSELQDSLDHPDETPARADHSLEDEMTKLLGELSRQRK
jgi:hypothetical protein